MPVHDRDRCRSAGIGDDVGFGTKPELARKMIGRAIDAAIPFGWVAAGRGIRAEHGRQKGVWTLWTETAGNDPAARSRPGSR